MYNEPLKVGRINRATERALDISLSGDVNIYLREEQLNDIASKRPDTYLAYIEELSSILRKPDFVSFDSERQSFFYCRAYAQSGAVQLVFLEVTHEQCRYHLKRVFKGGRVALIQELLKLHFARPVDKKVNESADRP